MKYIVAISTLLLSALAFTQSNYSLPEQESKLEQMFNRLRSAENNVDKDVINDSIRAILAVTLEREDAFDYPFELLKTVGIIDSPDGKLRIVNWNVEQEDFSHKYYCYVLHKDKKKDTSIVTELIDNTFGMPSQPADILTAEQWYGALYYRIIPVKKSGKTIYTVIGWDYYTDMSQVKLLDAIYISGKSVKLGSSIFKVGNETFKRVFYEHSKKAAMYLNYEPQRERIMMDHLSPESPSMKNFREFYVPDLSYDAFVYQRTKWVLQEDVIGVNKHEEETKQIVYTKDPKTGKVVETKIKSKWENPSDPGAPAGGSNHVAVTPEDETPVDKPKETKATKKDKRDAKELSLFKDVKKKKKRRLFRRRN